MSRIPPESLMHYMKKENIATFQTIDDTKAPVPTMEWDGIVAFNQAKFSLQVMKYEYYEYMRFLWRDVWESLVEKLGLHPLTAGDYKRLGAELTPDDVWQTRFTRLYRQGTEEKDIIHSFSIHVANEDCGVHLGWRAQSEQTLDENTSKGTVLADIYWSSREDYWGHRVTQKALCPLASGCECDISALKKAARSLVAVISVVDSRGKSSLLPE